MKVEFSHDEMRHVPLHVMDDVMKSLKLIEETLAKHIRVRK